MSERNRTCPFCLRDDALRELELLTTTPAQYHIGVAGAKLKVTPAQGTCAYRCDFCHSVAMRHVAVCGMQGSSYCLQRRCF